MCEVLKENASKARFHAECLISRTLSEKFGMDQYDSGR